MATFGVAIRVFPRKSQPETVSTEAPNGIPYEARGIYSSTPIDIATQGEGVFGEQVTTVDINAGEFPIMVKPGDRLQILPGQITGVGGDFLWWIADVDEDGQGGIMLGLQKTMPEEASYLDDGDDE